MKFVQVLLWLLVCFFVAVVPALAGTEDFSASEGEVLAKSAEEMSNFLLIQEEIAYVTVEAFLNLKCPTYGQDPDYVNLFFDKAFENGKLSEEWFSLFSKMIADLSGGYAKIEIAESVKSAQFFDEPYQALRVTTKGGSAVYVLTPSSRMGCDEPIKKQPLKYSLFRK